ncbi:MAG: transketolase C-terminal domain-containing protein [Oscillospiraceae bacterium]|jgi:transketolase
MLQLKQHGIKAARFGFGEALRDAGAKHCGLVVLGADISASVTVSLFRDAFPDRFFSLGIAEQNCVGVMAGLALEGKLPVFSTYGVFAALRTTDQIRISLCYNNLHAIIGGAHAGISVGPDGATHQALEDIAIMRALPNMTVLSPCDATQTYQATMAAVEFAKGPVYLRFGREEMPDFTTKEMGFTIGKAQTLIPGNDVCIIATGHLVWEAVLAASELKAMNISARLINMHTIKPIDTAAIVTAARETSAIVTAEEHQITGGLGGAVAEVLSKYEPAHLEMVGMPDVFGESGKARELMEKYGLTCPAIVEAAIKVINRKINA